MREEQVVHGHVCHSCQSRERDEAVAAAVAVELDERVAAERLDFQDAVIDGVHADKVEVAEQIQQIDLVLADFETGDGVAAKSGEIGIAVEAIEEQIVASPAVERVNAKTAFDCVVALPAIDRVRAKRAGDDIVEVVARDGEAARLQDRVLDVGAEGEVDAGEDGIGAAIGAFLGLVVVLSTNRCRCRRRRS